MACPTCTMRLLRLTRPTAPTSTTSQSLLFPQQRRAESTARRTRKLLRVRPAASLLTPPTETVDHIVYNPPSAMPNAYHTPQAFLPASDPRKLPRPSTPHRKPAVPDANDPLAPTQRLALAKVAAAAARKISAPTTAPTTTYGPVIAAAPRRRYHLSPAHVEEIRKLRAEDPVQWTVRRLAERFECSEFFVGLCAGNEEAKARAEAKDQVARARWGRGKREAREERERRKELWGVA